MSGHTPTPKLVMGHIVCMGPDDEEGTPYDEAVIHLDGDEDSEIEIHCPGALRLAPLIVKAVNNHEALLEFFKWAMRDGPWDGGDLDGGGIQDKAESLGLIVKTKYDIAKHGEEHSDFCEGDDFYEFAPGISDCVGRPLHSPPEGKP